MQKLPRIITGSAKNTRLEVPKRNTRPMTDRVKTALFGIIQEIIPNALVLDLYAGTGALGIECLSRGAKEAVFVDKSKEAIHALKINIQKTNFEKVSTVIKASVSRFLEEYEDFNLDHDDYDIIFFTPPYSDFKPKILENTVKVLNKGGFVVAEHPTTRKTDDRVGGLEKIDQREYGRTGLSFYRYCK